jgi:XRE family transcriptional regulator, fatty acid utilization regulator
MKPEPGSLGARLRHFRTEAGISQRELAERAGISQSKMSRIERGTRPSGDELERLGKALDLDPLKFPELTDREAVIERITALLELLR